MYQILKKAFEQNKPVSIYINIEEPDKCNSGYIAALNEREVSLLMLSDNGNVDALTVLSISQVFRIDMDGTYEQLLADAHRQAGNPYPSFTGGSGSLFKAIGEYAMKYHFPLWIAFHANDEIGDFGEVLEVMDDMIVITRLDDSKAENTSYISMKHIDFIACEYKTTNN